MIIDKLHALTSPRLAVIDFDATVQTAAHWLSLPGVGLVVVCNGSGNAEGVLSKSDLVRHLARIDYPALCSKSTNEPDSKIRHLRPKCTAADL